MSLWLGIHGSMERSRITFCFGHDGYFYNNRRVEEDDGWQRYADGAPEEADGAYRLVMLWLVALTFVYARRTCRLLGRCFASEHKARRKKPAVVRGTRTAFGLVQVLVVLLLYICGIGAGIHTGHWRQLEAVYNGRPIRSGSNICDWSCSAREWQAALTIQLITWRA